MHQQINACILKMLLILYPGQIDYYAGKSSKDNICKLIPNIDEVTYHPILVRSGYGKINIILRFLLSYFYNVKILLSSCASDVLIYNYNNPLSLFTINFLNRILKRKVLIFCHGEMEMLSGDNNYSPFMKILKWMLIRFFTANNDVQKNLWFCVLGENIKDNLSNLLPQSHMTHFVSIEHPYIFLPSINILKKDSSTINVGTVGEFTKRKGADDFFEVVKRFRCVNNIHFSVTGCIGYGLTTLESLNVNLPSNKGNAPIDDTEYNSRMSDLDYIIYFYPRSSYKFIASGAILDAVNHEKPIIAIKNNYFDHFFNKHGDVGFLVSDIDEMESVINDICLGKINVKYDFYSIKQELSPENVANQLAQILDLIMAK